MRILHVATLFTPDGAFGGPTRVASHQAAELGRRGHHVTLTGAGSGWDHEVDIPDVTVSLFPPRRSPRVLGFAGLRAPGVRRLVERCCSEVDVVHVHLARDLVTLPAVSAIRRRGVPYVLQCHGMIDPSDKALAGPLDRFATRPALDGAAQILTLTDTEEDGLRAVAGHELPFRRIANGIPDHDVVAGAASSVPEVLFLARLDRRKRPTTFVRVANALLDAGIRATFTVVGPDGGEAAAVDAEIGHGGHVTAVRRDGAVAPEMVTERMARAAVYVLPSVDEPFPMSVLEAMSVAVPVIVTDTCGLARVVEQSRCGIVVDAEESSLHTAIASLLADPIEARRAGERGRARVRETFSIAAVVDDLEESYRAAARSGVVA
ncbi:glycosyltransferase [Williamsia sp. MIQD14]|uniref:glycosyltransferase n=1 Tax=Williamsia sp. MIQD14 TaxID=3425703 RepID=UPI003DA110CF